MDVLTDVMEAIHLKSRIRWRLELTAPWGFGVEGGAPGFYVVTRGTCVLEAEGIEAIQLAAGDLVVLPKGHAHVLKDSRRTRAQPIEKVLGRCSAVQKGGCQPGGVHRLGGGGAPTTLVGGCFQLVESGRNPLVCALPPVLHVKGDGGTSVQWLEASLQFMASEMAAGHPGAETVVSRLADILFVQAVRAHLAEGSPTGWLKALVDPQIGSALALIHQRYAEPWTVDKLAEAVGMSRSPFAGRFSELVGEPPLTYLTRWRMDKAARLLRGGTVSISEIAERVGYEADAAFNKAFKRWVGVPPGTYRRNGGENVSAPQPA